LFAEEDTIPLIVGEESSYQKTSVGIHNVASGRHFLKVVKNDFGPVGDWLPFDIDEGGASFPAQTLISFMCNCN
jgi:hypothetical protein